MTVVPEGRKLLRLEVRNAQTPIERKPPWIKTRAKMGPEYTELKGLVRREGGLAELYLAGTRARGGSGEFNSDLALSEGALGELNLAVERWAE